MKQKKLVTAISIGLISLGLASSADAALFGRLPATPDGTDYQAYYDNIANLTWLADANYAKTRGYVTDHASDPDINSTDSMQWSPANTWATNLNIDGVSGWRLPTSDECWNDNCTGSEMGNLFYNVLGGSAGSSITTTHNDNYMLFSNVQSDFYWATTSTGTAWPFDMSDGSQTRSHKNYSLYSWPVQSGDISTVPLPAAMWLFGSGIIGMIAVARRGNANA